MPTRDTDGQLREALSYLLAAAASLRLLASIVAGFVTLAGDRGDFPPGRDRAALIFSAFGATGDTVSALLLLGVAALLAWGHPPPGAQLLLTRTVRVLLLVTAALVALRVAATYAYSADFSPYAAAQRTSATGIGLADLLLCFGGARILGRVDSARAMDDDAADAEPDSLVFAVDRGNGEVFAFFSYAEAIRSISIYSIEENEFVFYADDGTLLQASVVDDCTTFARTDADARTELMGHLRKFAQEKSLVVHEPDDPTAYAVPISDWQWLELWPRWMRGLGRLVNRLRR